MNGMDRDSTPGGGRLRARWLRNRRWSSGVIRDQSAENLSAAWTLTIGWNLLTILGLLSSIRDRGRGADRLWLFVLFFSVIGIGLLIWAGRRTRRISKFGESVFHLQTLPAIPGGELAGVIRVARTFGAESSVHLHLVCISRFMTGMARNSNVVDRVVWQESQTLDRLPPCDQGMEIPVLFQIPPDAQPTSELEFGDGVRWILEVRCKTRGVGYFSRFTVPVFAVDPSDFAAVRHRDVVIERASIESGEPRSGRGERGIACERFAGGRLRICFGAARNKVSAAMTTIVGLVLIGIAIGSLNWPGFRPHRVIAISIASLVLFAGGGFVIRAFLKWLAAYEITVRYGSLTVERIAPLFDQERTFKIGDISEVFNEAKLGVSNRHALMLKKRDGEVLCLAGDIIQKDYAEWLVEEIKDALGVFERV